MCIITDINGLSHRAKVLNRDKLAGDGISSTLIDFRSHC